MKEGEERNSSLKNCLPLFFFGFIVINLCWRWVIVIGHVRGGGEMGKLWYREGKAENKKNSFIDTITIAKYLIEVSFFLSSIRKERGKKENEKKKRDRQRTTTEKKKKKSSFVPFSLRSICSLLLILIARFRINIATLRRWL